MRIWEKEGMRSLFSHKGPNAQKELQIAPKKLNSTLLKAWIQRSHSAWRFFNVLRIVRSKSHFVSFQFEGEWCSKVFLNPKKVTKLKLDGGSKISCLECCPLQRSAIFNNMGNNVNQFCSFKVDNQAHCEKHSPSDRWAHDHLCNKLRVSRASIRSELMVSHSAKWVGWHEKSILPPLWSSQSGTSLVGWKLGLSWNLNYQFTHRP